MTSDDIKWPEELASESEARRWVSASLPAGQAVAGQARIIGKNNGGFTARFTVIAPGTEQDVVFKTNFLPQFRSSGRLSAVLSRLCPGDVPHLLAWRELPERVDTLFQLFVGQEITRASSLEALCEMARALARVQTRVAAMPDAMLGLPRLSLEQVPALLDLLILDIQNRYHSRFHADDDALIKRFDIPADFVERLMFFRPKLDEWAAELATLRCPESIDHVDLLPHNAALQEDGHVLIYDWEQATIGCPLFSLDVLLAFAQDWEENFSQGLTIRPEQETDGAATLRKAYLEALPWGTWEERERAFTLALCLSPVRYAWAEGLLATQFGQEEWWAEDMAWWLTRALRRWERLAAA